MQKQKAINKTGPDGILAAPDCQIYDIRILMNMNSSVWKNVMQTCLTSSFRILLSLCLCGLLHNRFFETWKNIAGWPTKIAFQRVNVYLSLPLSCSKAVFGHVHNIPGKASTSFPGVLNIISENTPSNMNKENVKQVY